MVLAAFAGGGGGGGGGNYSSSSNSFKDLPKIFREENFPKSAPEKISQVLGTATSDPWKFICSLLSPIPVSFWFALALGILIALIFYTVLRLFLFNWAKSALLSSVHAYSVNNTEITLASGSNLGKKYWKRLFLANFVLWGIFILCIIGGIILSVLLAIITPILTAIFAIPFVLMIIISIILLSVWSVYLDLTICLEDYPVKKAISSSFQMTKKFFWQGLLMGIINQALGCALSCAVLTLLGIVGGTIALVTVINPIAGMAIGLPLGSLLIIFFLVSTLLYGIFKAFTTTNWVMFYEEINGRGEILSPQNEMQPTYIAKNNETIK